jgi:hypothetical protein
VESTPHAAECAVVGEHFEGASVALLAHHHEQHTMSL